MTFRFTCPHCHAATDVEDQYAGQSGACFSCGQPIFLPTLSSLTTASSGQNSQMEEDLTVAQATAHKAAEYQATADDPVAHPPVARETSAGEIQNDVVQFDKKRQLLLQESNRSWRACLTTLIALPVIILIGGVIWWLVATFGTSIGLLGDEGESRSRRNLQRIADAMMAYHDDYGSFPPAHIPDATGKPLHSWRVLLLPYLGEDTLYSSYNFDEPWDGPNNSQLEWQMPKVYRSQTGGNTATINFETNYMVISGFESAFPPNSSPVNKKQILDGLANTILVVEIENNGVSWLEPIDLDASKMSFAVNSKAGTEIGSTRSRGALIATADGVVHHVDDDVTPILIESMMTINGGEPVQASDLD